MTVTAYHDSYLDKVLYCHLYVNVQDYTKIYDTKYPEKSEWSTSVPT